MRSNNKNNKYRNKLLEIRDNGILLKEVYLKEKEQCLKGNKF
jgi:hypothetical protein